MAQTSIVRQTLLLALFASPSLAQSWSGGGGGGGGSYGGFPTYYDKVVIAHAVFGTLAWALFFPFGAVMIRALSNGHTSVWVHGGIQLGSLGLLVINAGTGIWMAQETHQLSEYHPIIGLVLFAFAVIQSVAGVLSHLIFKRNQRRNLVGIIHTWTGRAAITLGMINGGLGLLLSEDGGKRAYIGYGVVTALIWVAWTANWVRWEIMGSKQSKEDLRSEKKTLSPESGSGSDQALPPQPAGYRGDAFGGRVTQD